LAIKALTAVHYHHFYKFFQNLMNTVSSLCQMITTSLYDCCCDEGLTYCVLYHKFLVITTSLWNCCCCDKVRSIVVFYHIITPSLCLCCRDEGPSIVVIGEYEAWMLLSYISHLADHCRAIDSLYSWTAIQLRICQYCITIYVAC